MWPRADSNPDPDQPRLATLAESDPGRAGADEHRPADSAPNSSGLQATEAGAGRDPAPRSAQRFTYASGSRPLEGYTIKRGIGAGGFGEVYYALSDGGKEVALKLIRRNLEVELRGISHCLNLKHPNLLGLYDIKTGPEGDTWVVMEYVAGDCLSDVLAANPQGLPVEEALQWIHGIAAGAAYLHDRGIVHRDLKPGNIFCDEGVVKIGDYGLSKFISVSRRSGQTESVGTVHYMAPEVGNGRYGKGIDIYALGVISYELVTGEVPFEGESVGEVLMKHLTAQPNLSRLPEAFRAPIAQCLEKDPERRIQSVGELLSLLPAPPASPTRARVMPVASPQPLFTATPAGAAAPAVVDVAASTEEPIQRWLTDTWRELATAWQQANMNFFLRAAIIVVAVIGFLSTSGIWLPLLMLYAVYRGVRGLHLAYHTPNDPAARPALARPVVPPPAPAPRPAAAASPRPFVVAKIGIGDTPSTRGKRRSSRRRRSERALEAMPVKSPRQWNTELLGSLFLGPPIAVAMTVLTALVYGFWADSMVLHSNELAWIALTGAAATWLVLIPGKFWEGVEGDPWLRRIVMLVAGAALGLIACLLAAAFEVEVRADSSPGTNFVQWLPTSAFDEKGLLNPAAFMAYFAMVMAIPSWWMLTDPRRESRLGLWNVAWVTFVAWIVGRMVGFPVEWAMLPITVAALSVQLSSACQTPQSPATAA